MQPSLSIGILYSSVEEFLTDLRSGQGYKEDSFKRVCESIEKCADEWKGSDVVPKEAANLFVGLLVATHSMSYAYSGLEGEIIMKACVTIQSLVFKCLTQLVY